MASRLARLGRFDGTTSARDVRLDPTIDGHRRAQDLLEALADLSGSTAQIITPEGLGADPTGVEDAFDYVKEALETASAGGFRCELRGQYKLIPTSTIELSSGLLVQGGGRLHVAGAPIGNRLIDINIAPLATLTILAIADSTYDYAGVNSSDSTVTRLQLDPGDIADVEPGMEVKIVSDDLPIGGIASSYQGEFAYVIAVASPYVYLSCRLRYTFTMPNSPRLLVLDQAPDKAIFARDLNFSAEWDDLVANDWSFEYLRIAGATEPVLANIRMRDGADTGIRLAGTLRAVSEGLAFKRFRNAVITKSIPGYGVRETGARGSIHIGLRGTDVRHIWTSTTAAGAGLDPLVNGRTQGAQIIGGIGVACNASAFDSHSDADGVTFFGCKTYGGYDGEGSGYSGFQLRGDCRAVQCEAYDVAVGYLLKREYASEIGCMRKLIDCEYRGAGDGFIVSSSAEAVAADGGLLDYDIRGFVVETTAFYANRVFSKSHGTIKGMRIKHRATAAAHRSLTFVPGSADSTLKVELEADIVDASGGTYRAVTWEDTGIVVDLDLTVVNGSRDWTGWLAAETGYLQPITAHAVVEADTLPLSVDGVPTPPGGTVWTASVQAKRGRVGNNGRRIRVSSSGDVTVGPGKSTALVISIMITANASGSRVTAFTAGNVEGQMMAIHVAPLSGNDLEIVPSEVGLIRAQATITLNAKGGALFVWVLDADGDNAADGGMWCHVTT